MPRRTRIYVAAPLSKGDRLANVQRAVDAGRELIQRGYAPLIPHLSNAMDPDDSLGYEAWLEIALAWVIQADAVLRLPGESAGADREVSLATAIGIPVYFGLDDLRCSPPSQGHEGFHTVLRQMAALHNRKASDYGTDADPFANIRATAEFGLPAWLGSVLRMNDKMSRIKAYAQKGTLANESVEDSFLDCACYAIIALVMHREEKSPVSDIR